MFSLLALALQQAVAAHASNALLSCMGECATFADLGKFEGAVPVQAQSTSLDSKILSMLQRYVSNAIHV